MPIELDDLPEESPSTKRKNTKRAGDNRERLVKKIMESRGYQCKKARSSLGPADIVAYHPRTKDRRLIQVKANKGSPWMHFRKEERQALIEEAEMFNNCTAWLVHWPPYGKCSWIPSSKWPK